MTDKIEKAVMALGGGLMMLGIVGLGIVEILAGKPYGAVPLTNEAGAVVATPMVDPALRTGLVIAGLAVFGLYGAYKLAMPVEPERETAGHEAMVD